MRSVISWRFGKDSDVDAARILNIDLLQTQPEIGRPGRIVGTRELIVPGTPYIIPYRVRHQRLELLAIFHGRQHWPASL